MPHRNGVVGNQQDGTLKRGIKSLGEQIIAAGYEVAFKGKIEDSSTLVLGGVKRIGGIEKPLALANVEEFLKTRNKSKPLALFVGPTDTHTVWPPLAQVRIDPARVALPAKTPEAAATRVMQARYVEGVEDLDRTVGEVRGMVGQYLGAENTLVIYTSDHGQNWLFGKWSLYETGVRTPILAVWPGKIKPKTTTKAMVSWIDLIPTLIDIGGGTVPNGIDGRSFKNVMLGKVDCHRQEIFSVHKGDGVYTQYPSRAVRTEDWKYILNLHPELYFTTHMDVPNMHAFPNWAEWEQAARQDPKAGQFLYDYRVRPAEELYLVNDDPYETNNLAFNPVYADVLAALRTRVRSEMNSWQDDESIGGDGKGRLIVDNLVPPAIKVLYPNGGERLQPGAQVKVVWTAAWRGTSNVKIEYGDGNGWTTIADSVPHDGSFVWNVPAGLELASVALRVTSGDGKIADESDRKFAISRAP